jgi:hypothetical protein
MTAMARLESRITSFLRTGEGDFESLALELLVYQFEKNLPYRTYCRAQGLKPSGITRWHEIPAVPIAAFKSTDLATFPVGQAAAQFQSSGTTGKVRSRHYFKTLTYYETALKASFAKWVLPDEANLPFFILAPSPAEAPLSSLTWMFDVVKRTYGAAGCEYLVRRGRLDEERLATLLSRAEATQRSVAILGTTIALLGFFDWAAFTGHSYSLARGSRLMDTGGMKTSEREITRLAFVRLAHEILGIPEDQCINEYGMCELSSQFYGRGPSTVLAGPPWTRTLVIDPVTGRPALSGHVGLLRHFDLANVGSVLAVQTEDVGIHTPEGFILRGRDPNAEVKGCSLSAESFLK